MIRAAYRTIGQAVLDARAMQPTVDTRIEAASEALGCEYALLYLVDDSRRTAGIAAGVGRPRSDESGEDPRLPLAGSHPTVASLREGRMRIVRGTDERPDGVTGERFEQRQYTRVFLQFRTASEDLGTLELGYAAGARPAGRREQAHLGPRSPIRVESSAQHAIAAPHRRGVGAQDGGARGRPGNPAQPAAQGVPPGARLGVRQGVLQVRTASSAATSTTSASWPASRRGSAW